MIDSELKECPNCKQQMLRVHTGYCRTSNPPQYQTEWRCGCGHREEAPYFIPKGAEERFTEEWKRVNS